MLTPASPDSLPPIGERIADEPICALLPAR